MHHTKHNNSISSRREWHPRDSKSNINEWGTPSPSHCPNGQGLLAILRPRSRRETITNDTIRHKRHPTPRMDRIKDQDYQNEPFRQIGHTPKLQRTQKLQSQAERVRYLMMTDCAHFLLQCENCYTRTVLNKDFHCVHTNRDPSHPIADAHFSVKEKLKRVPRQSKPGIAQPVNITHATSYSDGRI